MNNKLVLLACPITAVGHVNAVIGALTPLARRGHRVIIVLEKAFAGKAIPYGFEECVMTYKKDDDVQKPGETFAKRLWENKVIGNLTSTEKMQNMRWMVENEGNRNDELVFGKTVKMAIEQYKPDLIYVDNCSLTPPIYYSGIPWIKNMSTVPLFYILEDDVPPGCSGFPSDVSTDKIKEFNKFREYLFFSSWYNDIFEKMGYARYPDDRMMPETQVMNVYAYPEELNFPFIRNRNWFNLEVFNKVPMTSNCTLKDYVPKPFYENNLNSKFSGKYIYISMGSMGSVDLVLMNRLVNVLRNTNHKYIVSKGPRYEEYELADNMFGDRYLPQTKIVPLVDLVITHGGNNTITETFAMGKPMIVMPLFADQFDNAQRLHETGLGAHIHPYEYKDEELIETIDRLLNDEQLLSRLISAAKRIHSIDKHEELADKIEELVFKK